MVVLDDELVGRSQVIFALAALLNAAFPYVKLLVKWIKDKRRPVGPKLKKKSLATALMLFLISYPVLPLVQQIFSLKSTAVFLNARLTEEAWGAYTNNQFKIAIKKANECIDLFESAAKRQQGDFVRTNAPAPPTNTFSDQERTNILSWGILNDVATSFFIKGRALEKRKHIAEAREAYQMATNFTYARTWDPQGQFFWPPAQAAADRLSTLDKK